MRTLAWACLLLASPLWAKENELQVFRREVYALHERQLAQHAVRMEEESGAYQGAAAGRYHYVDTRYYDAQSGVLLSRVRRDAADARLLQIIEVNVYEQGRLVRDFGSISLPWAPLFPERSYINLHRYRAGLHSFRQWDYYGEVAYESCEGSFAGKKVNIGLDGSEIDAQSTAGADYHACFDDMPKSAKDYLHPH